MLRIVITLVYMIVCAGAIGTYCSSVVAPKTLDAPENIIAENRALAFVFLILFTWGLAFVDLLFKKKRIEVISAIYFGLIIGFILAYLFRLAIEPLLGDTYWMAPASLILTLALPYVCISLLLQTKDDFRFLIPYVEFSKEIKGDKPIVVDAAALIDGRIADVAETKVFDADLLVPQFVLNEVQDIADATDKVRRARGRRGLEVLSKLQNNPGLDVRVIEIDNDIANLQGEQLIIETAKRNNARILTNDFNLNKVATAQGVAVINLNDVGNALKPRFIPGERITFEIIREGESSGQGVGYLDDGTMVVCEQASNLIGQEITAVVTSLLQSSAGRMIFVRQVTPPKPAK